MALELKILAVDDETASMDLFRGIVEPLGYEVVGLTDSRAAAQPRSASWRRSLIWSRWTSTCPT